MEDRRQTAVTHLALARSLNYRKRQTASAISLISAADKYKKSTDNTYKTAFAEAAVEVVTGTEATGDAAVEKLNGLLEGLSDVEALKGTLTTGSTEEKANAIVKIMDLFSKKN